MTPVAIVTGAGTGIGRATAMALSSAGFIVALVGRTHATLEKVAFDIKSARGAANSFVADVAKPSQAEKMIEKVFKAHGRIDALVNNVGLAPAIPLAEMSVAQWQEVLEVNLSSAFYTTRAVWPIMERQFAKKKTSDPGYAGGVIVNISSAASRDPFPGLGAYAAAKIGINMLTLMTAREGEAVGIRAHCIAPGGGWIRKCCANSLATAA